MNLLKNFANKDFLLKTNVFNNLNKFSTFAQHLVKLPILSTNGLPNKANLQINNSPLLFTNTNLNITQVREYKVKTRLRKRCKSCYFVWRNGRLYVECDEHGRHRQHHIKSMLKGYDSIAHGYDIKVERALKIEEEARKASLL